MLEFERLVATGIPALDSGIGETALKTFNGKTYLNSASGFAGGIVVWELVEGVGPVQIDVQYYDSAIIYQMDVGVVPVTLAGHERLLIDVEAADGLISYELNPDSTIDARATIGTAAGGGNFGALTQIISGSVEFLTISHEATGQIGTYQVEADGSLSLMYSFAGRASDMETLRSGSGQFVFAAEARTDTITAYKMNMSTGSLIETDQIGWDDGLGLNTPTAMKVVEAHGKSWVLVAASESNSISVMQLGADGSLYPTDHVLDTMDTRFRSVQDMELVKVNGHVFVVAGGGDDGLTLMTLSPDGQLIHLDSFADTTDSGLQNVQSLSVAQVGNKIQIFSASQQDAGLTQLSVSLENLGDIAKGSGAQSGTDKDDMLCGGLASTTLSGGAGNDILIAGHAETSMSGGLGDDIFVMRSGSGLTTITDFEAGKDRLDLFDYPMLRNPGQLDFTATSYGARIEYQDEAIEIYSVNGAPLSSSEVFGAGFSEPDHVPVDLGSGGSDDHASPGVVGSIIVNSAGANPGLTDAEVRFTPENGAPIYAEADDQGRFNLEIPEGVSSGNVNFLKTYSTASAEITALDALQVLRLSVGLEPTWGDVAPENLIAADINQDGTVNALDALAILQAAVGQTSDHTPEWVFLDADADLSDISVNSVSYHSGASVELVDGEFAVEMTSILLGNMEAV